MMLLPRLREIRKKRAREVSITTASSVRPFSVIQMTLSRVLYRKWGLIWDWSTSSSLRRFCSSCSMMSSIKWRIVETMERTEWLRCSTS